MATLYVSEYSIMGQVPNTAAQMPLEPPIAEYTVSISGSSDVSQAFNIATRYVRLNSDVACSVSLGTNPTATINNGRMSPNQTEYRSVPEGGSFKVAVISNS